MAENTQAKILLVEDDAPQRKTLGGFLEKKGYEIIEADCATAAVARTQENNIDLLVTDLRLGGPDGIDLLNSLKSKFPDLQTIILTAYGTVDDAVRAMRAGAYDFISKPIDLAHLEVLVEKALEKVRLSRENRSLREFVKSSSAFSGMIGESEAIRQIKNLASKVAASKASVLILGESGTGKEVLVRSIHLASPRNRKPFITVNCAALPGNLIESELFGYEKGAFTGAINRKPGRFELADGGTLFLDEVGEIPLHIQVKLLNILQSGQFERVGGTETIQTDVRIVAATNRDLKQQVAEGSFREDLYYRLNVVSITMPALRERTDDIGLLINYFLEKQADLSGKPLMKILPDALKKLQQYSFPGNVRELENWIERAVVLAEGDVLSMDDFPDQNFHNNSITNMETKPLAVGLEEQLDDLEITLIKETLEKNDGNQSAAARDLKISERSIRYKMKKHGL